MLCDGLSSRSRTTESLHLFSWTKIRPNSPLKTTCLFFGKRWTCEINPMSLGNVPSGASDFQSRAPTALIWVSAKYQTANFERMSQGGCCSACTCQSWCNSDKKRRERLSTASTCWIKAPKIDSNGSLPMCVKPTTQASVTKSHYILRHHKPLVM